MRSILNSLRQHVAALRMLLTREGSGAKPATATDGFGRVIIPCDSEEMA